MGYNGARLHQKVFERRFLYWADRMGYLIWGEYGSWGLDHTRPVIDTSGNYHVVTDIYDIHDYEQNVEVFASHYEPMKNGGPVDDNYPNRQHHEGQPYFVSEYGGILWNDRQESGWGYGSAPKTMDEFADRYVGLNKTLLENPGICALCYTQLYDVEQEKNGIYTYDREHKFPADILARMKAAMMTKAAIEE